MAQSVLSIAMPHCQRACATLRAGFTMNSSSSDDRPDTPKAPWLGSNSYSVGCQSTRRCSFPLRHEAKKLSRDAIAPKRAFRSTAVCALPSQRTAVVVDRNTPAGETRIAQIDMLKCGDDEVLCEVCAIGINALDWFITDAIKKVPPFLRQGPFVPCKDFSGRVVAVGSRVTQFKVGDDVYGMTGFTLAAKPDGFTPEALASGAASTYAKIKANECAKKPTNLTHLEAAGIPLAVLTAWKALVDTAKLKPGSKVLILGGGGGVGTLCIQLAKAYLKAGEVVVTASKGSEALVRSLGADRVVDYKSEQFEEVLKGDNFDVVVDAVGYDRKCSRAKAVLKPGSGQLVDLIGPPSIGYLRRNSKADGPVEYGQELIKYGKDVRYNIVGVEPNGAALATVADLMREGKMRPVVDKVFNGLEQLQQAWDYNRSGRAHGKVVVNLEAGKAS
eukprot:jgi/Mesvir1/22966/Mv25085-RA.1